MSRQEGFLQEDCEECPLLLLPAEALELVCQHLDIENRVRLLSSCKQLWTSVRLCSSPALWGSVAVSLQSLPQAEAFARWLAAKRDLVLSLSMSSRLSYDDFEDWQRDCQEVYRCMETALSALAGGPLQQLRLEPDGQVELHSSVLSRLPNLHSLILEVDEGSSLELGADFPQLTALTQLAVGLEMEIGVQLEQGSLPAGLKRLSLCCPWDTITGEQLQVALQGVESLQELHLTGYKVDTFLGSDRLGSLTRLTLRPEVLDEGYSSVPAEIAALTNLERLDLEYGYSFAPDFWEPDWQPLMALTKLTHLSLSGWLLSEWPAELQALPRLKALNLESNCLQPPLPDWAVWGQLEALCLPLPLAAGCLQQLGQLTSLTFLELDALLRPVHRDFDIGEALLQVFSALEPLPRLRALTVTEDGPFTWSTEGAMEARQQLSKCKPWPVIDGVNPLETSYNDFDRVLFS